MFFKIHFDGDINPALYEDYCKYLFDSIKKDVSSSIVKKKYDVRMPYVLQSSVIKWIDDPLPYINLPYYINNCLIMKKERGEYVIGLDPYKKIPRSRTKVSTLVRLLEYGNEILPPLPVIRTVLSHYSKNYPYMLLDFIRERMT